MLLVLPTMNALSFHSFNEDFLKAYCVTGPVTNTDKTLSPLTWSVHSRGESSKQANNWIGMRSEDSRIHRALWEPTFAPSPISWNQKTVTRGGGNVANS